MNPLRLFGLVLLGALLHSHVAEAQFAQLGPKLVGTGATGQPGQGYSVALSANGNTMIVGGPDDDNQIGAAWVFTRSGTVWTQQGAKLVGTGSDLASEQGTSVALSADGNTAAVGGDSDNAGIGAVWVYTRSGGGWTQQGTKLAGTVDAGGPSYLGASVALSADGNTMIVGAEGDNLGVGGAWVYTRSGGVWTLQAKLVGSGSVGYALEGGAVALSADGNTAIVGGSGDYPAKGGTIGAAWVFIRSGGVWTQQGNKLVGTGAAGPGEQGFSVALSADGNTAMVSAPYDDETSGAAWIYTRGGGAWTQQAKLVGTGVAGPATYQGYGAGLSGDGNRAVLGGPVDNNYVGAVWFFTRSGGAWSQQGAKRVGTGAAGLANQGFSAAMSADGSIAVATGVADNGNVGATWAYADGPVLVTALSSKVHGSAGTFYLPLSLDRSNPTTEPRQGPTQTILFAFDRAIAAATVAVTEGTAIAGAPTVSLNNVYVTLTGVSDQQYVTIALSNVSGTDGTTGGSANVRVGYLAADVNQNRVVSLADCASIQALETQSVTSANFLKDVNANGAISVADYAICNANLTRALPAP